jgi:hypothetical protein
VLQVRQLGAALTELLDLLGVPAKIAFDSEWLATYWTSLGEFVW